MIRLNKPVQIMEWGLGTSTANQNWTEIAKGRFAGKPKRKDGITTLVIEVEGSLNRQNENTEYVKVMQQGEGMTPQSARWGEVAMGSIAGVSRDSGKVVMTINVPTATKFSD